MKLFKFFICKKRDIRICALNNRIKKLESDQEAIMLAITELVESINPTKTKIVKTRSAIASMYANMIKKGLITIDDIHPMYKEETLAILVQLD